jgi:hypothetical protein
MGSVRGSEKILVIAALLLPLRKAHRRGLSTLERKCLDIAELLQKSLAKAGHGSARNDADREARKPREP